MLINIVDDGLMIVAETDFEQGYLESFPRNNLNAFVKCGMTPADVIGIKITKTERTKVETFGLGEDDIEDGGMSKDIDTKEVMTMSEFINSCNVGQYTDDDGYAHFVSIDKELNRIENPLNIYPSEVLLMLKDNNYMLENYQVVYWFNR